MVRHKDLTCALQQEAGTAAGWDAMEWYTVPANLPGSVLGAGDSIVVVSELVLEVGRH